MQTMQDADIMREGASAASDRPHKALNSAQATRRLERAAEESTTCANLQRFLRGTTALASGGIYHG